MQVVLADVLTNLASAVIKQGIKIDQLHATLICRRPIKRSAKVVLNFCIILEVEAESG